MRYRGKCLIILYSFIAFQYFISFQKVHWCFLCFLKFENSAWFFVQWDLDEE